MAPGLEKSSAGGLGPLGGLALGGSPPANRHCRTSLAPSLSLDLSQTEAAIASQVEDDKFLRQGASCSTGQANQDIREFLESREGSSLRAWLRHFDRNNDQKITLSEFLRGMRSLAYPGDATWMFEQIDKDGSGELSLDEIDSHLASIWRRFRAWSVAVFQGPREMLLQLCCGAPVLDRMRFVAGLLRFGWTQGWEDIIYDSLDVDDNGFISVAALRWLEGEKKRQRRKQEAKKKAIAQQVKRSDERCYCLFVQDDFKAFLKQRFGAYLRAWRKVLDVDGSMAVQKSELFKACSEMGWQGDVRLLWKAFDKDDSGLITLEELDPQTAEVLAHFQSFAQRLGGSAEAFCKLDKLGSRRLKVQEFSAACKALDFRYGTKALFHGLDWEGKRFVVQADLEFLDKWRPPNYLTATPSKEAAHEFRALLLKLHKNYLKAWRQCLDTDSSNRVTWEEFLAACHKIRFMLDSPPDKREAAIAGAWRALDEDLSGFITLRELDDVASDILLSFKQWADEEFGGVRSAFSVFDDNGSGEVKYREFRRACRTYGYDRDVRTLFDAVDMDKQGVISPKDLMFLDDWETVDFADDEKMKLVASFQEEHPTMKMEETTITYVSEGPGPGHYGLPPMFGSGPMSPIRFSGAFTFRKRTEDPEKLPRPLRESADMPSPVDYSPSLAPTLPGHASSCFGLSKTVRASNESILEVERRHLKDADKRLSTLQGAAQGLLAAPTQGPASPAPRPWAPFGPDHQFTPGPGQYSPTTRSSGPSISCSPRRPLAVHPLFNDFRRGVPVRKPPALASPRASPRGVGHGDSEYSPKRCGVDGLRKER